MLASLVRLAWPGLAVWARLVAPRHSGPWGEWWAAWYLRGRGYRILGRNVRVRGGEVDLLAAAGRRLVLVEVKTRESTVRDAWEAVDARKRRRLVRAAWQLLRGVESCGVQFDVVAVIGRPGRRPRQIAHRPAAFSADDT